MIPIGMLDSWALGGLVALNVNENGENKRVMWMEIAIGLLGIALLTVYNANLQDCTLGESYQLYKSAKGYMHNPLTGNIISLLHCYSRESCAIVLILIGNTRYSPPHRWWN